MIRKPQNTRIFNHKTHKTYKMPRRRADNIPKDFMLKQNVDHE